MGIKGNLHHHVPLREKVFVVRVANQPLRTCYRSMLCGEFESIPARQYFSLDDPDSCLD